MVSDVYFPRINGVSTSIQTFRDSLQALGHDIQLIAPRYSAEDSAEEGISRIKARPVPFDPEDRIMSVSAVDREIARLHREKPIDLIHIQTPFSAHLSGKRMARRLGIPCIETYHTHFEEYMHNYVPFIPRRVFRPLIRFITRRQCHNLQGLIVPSSAMLKVIRDYHIQLPTRILPTGIDPERFSRGDGHAFRKRHHIEPDRPVMVHLGRIGHEKNIDFLLHVHHQVLQQLPQTLFVIAGEGPALEHLKQLSDKLGTRDNIRFVGYLDRNSTLLDCYRAGNVFVFSSRTETQGLVLLEAMACGVPVVSTAELGTRDILLPQRGALVVDEEVDQFATTVQQVLELPELQRRMSREGQDYVHEWSHSALAHSLADLYRHTIDTFATQAANYPPAERSTS
ncbi:MAG: glycosyltransferase [Thiohalophilus sp.]|uniref:glycosyltransferase n=1 Tax=Thiohalophilus sp. TaxID=3028392 RepID=UPI00286FC70F|nr:glycosyltransferase [Thiohalophilus sp.]MDR9437043.1 glycosyltransferase [Thiohalophilus sp.]